MSFKRKDPPCEDNKEKKKPSLTVEPISILSLPNDLLLNCLASVSRLYYPTLSLVCKTFRSIISSPELYRMRSCLNRTESCLYLCLHYRVDPNPYWYTLCKNPNRNVTSKSSGYCFVPIPSPTYPKGNVTSKSSDKSLVIIGSDIYQIGGDGPSSSSSSSVYVLDCRTHTWHQAPSMRVGRNFSTASLIDGKIFVAGVSKDDNHSVECVEVFDPETQSWGLVTEPGVDKSNNGHRPVKSLGLEGKLYLFGHLNVVYNPKEDIWCPIGVDRCLGDIANRTRNTSYCVIDNVVFFCSEGVFRWYDSKVKVLKELKGLEGLPNRFGQRGLVNMADHGGKIAVSWIDFNGLKGSYGIFPEHEIFCAVIALERRDGDEIWGKVEWSDHAVTISGFWSKIDVSDIVITLPSALSRVDVLSATI